MHELQMRRAAVRIAVMLLFAAASCERAPEPGAATPEASPTGVVDSIIPIDSALRRFRADLPAVASLASGATSLAGLVRELVTALAAHDTLALERLAVNRAEYAWLYYPGTPISRPPYELPPALAWFQLQEANRTGALRLFRTFGGRHLELQGQGCAGEPVTEGANRVWTRCVVTLGVDGKAPARQRLFSAVLERDGRFAFLSFHNDF